MTTMDYSDVLTAINAGDLDEGLNHCANSIRSRQTYLATQAAAGIAPGDLVQLHTVSPKYLIGAIGTVVNNPGDGKKLTITLTDNYGRFTAGANLKVSLHCIKKVG